MIRDDAATSTLHSTLHCTLQDTYTPPNTPNTHNMLHTRFLLSKGFGWQDDLEFCPVVLDSNNTLQNQSIDNSPTALYNSIQSPSSSSSSTTATATATSASVSTTEQTANPITPPNSSLNPHFNSISTKSSINTNTNTTASPILHTPRAKKVLDIVNPHTGMRVGSPSSRNIL